MSAAEVRRAREQWSAAKSRRVEAEKAEHRTWRALLGAMGRNAGLEPGVSVIEVKARPEWKRALFVEVANAFGSEMSVLARVETRSGWHATAQRFYASEWRVPSHECAQDGCACGLTDTNACAV